MNISTYTCILSILLVVKQVNSSCSVYSKELDDQCSTYCYQVVKPLLQYVNPVQSMTQELNELQHTIKSQAAEIKNLNELIKSRDMQLAQQINCLGKSTDLHEIRLPTGQIIIVPCESNLLEAGAGWTVIQRRKNDGLDFNRTWSEYNISITSSITSRSITGASSCCSATL
ncbi:uncharacterized protein LOC117570480 [Drosophila albomicans]|uniref:Uncharacterized protein LOC117570480 n=1 Tax=Drosophila albomicans TaxID=7291 RepID=A0A9C6T148_DROAB|nr:uncharacterized protein LOC117570480 [Drosophila albomicans]